MALPVLLLVQKALTAQPLVVYISEATFRSGSAQSMRCTKCGWQEDKVIDSRTSKEGSTTRRRRECLACGFRFTTYEQIEHEGLMVIKRDGRAEEFSREKFLAGIRKACQKRPVSAKTIDELAGRIIDEVTS